MKKAGTFLLVFVMIPFLSFSPKTQITLTIHGELIPDDYSINLTAGWNLIGYWLDDPMSPEDAFSELIATGILEYVSAYEGGGLFYDPNGLPFLNTLTQLGNGFGYWVKVSEDCQWHPMYFPGLSK